MTYYCDAFRAAEGGRRGGAKDKTRRHSIKIHAATASVISDSGQPQTPQNGFVFGPHYDTMPSAGELDIKKRRMGRMGKANGSGITKKSSLLRNVTLWGCCSMIWYDKECIPCDKYTLPGISMIPTHSVARNVASSNSSRRRSGFKRVCC